MWAPRARRDLCWKCLTAAQICNRRVEKAKVSPKKLVILLIHCLAPLQCKMHVLQSKSFLLCSWWWLKRKWYRGSVAAWVGQTLQAAACCSKAVCHPRRPAGVDMAHWMSRGCLELLDIQQWKINGDFMALGGDVIRNTEGRNSEGSGATYQERKHRGSCV